MGSPCLNPLGYNPALMRRLLATAALVCVAALLSHPSAASTLLSRYTVTSWSARDGLPAGTVWALAQDGNGFLWLGSDAGLLRFDGSRFSTWDSLDGAPLPGSAVRALLARADGSLWVGFDEPGGISRIQGRTVRSFGEADGLPGGQVRMLVEDAGGTVWAGTSRGLFRFVDERWQAVTAGLPAESRGVYSGYTTRRGTLLVGTDDGVYGHVGESDHFEPVAIFGRVDNGVRGITEDHAGRIVSTDATTGFRQVPAAQAQRDLERGRGLRIVADRQGSVWVATGGHGVWKVAFDASGQATIEKTSAVTGLVPEGAFSLLEDRDGNIWAGTSDGITRFTTQRVETFTDFGVAAAIDSTADGRVWVATFDGLNEFARRRGEWQMTRQHLPGQRVRSLHTDGLQRVWVATDHLLARFEPGRATPTIVRTSAAPREIESMVADDAGRLWIFEARGVWLRVEVDGRVVPVPTPAALQGQLVRLARIDRQGRIWLTFLDGGGAIVSADGGVRIFGPADGASAGPYRAFLEGADGVVWLGGRYGLTRHAGDRFTTVSSTSGFPVDYVKAVQADAQGTLWLGTSVGIVRVAPAEYEKALAGQPVQWSYHTLDKQDGVAGTPRQLSDRSAGRDAEGGLWFVTGGGVTRVDPRHVLDAPTPVRAQVVGVTVDGRSSTPSRLSQLAAGSSKIEIDYSALNLTAPHRTRFRYRLDGFDREWVYAEFRHTAFYTNLPPGEYRFRVAASETGSSWTETGDSWRFAIQPRFYQTRWLPVLVAVACGLPIWGLWHLRARRMREQFAILLRERMRLSREIHDTLLQSMVGVALQCDVLASAAESVPLRGRLTQLRKRVEEYIDECRQSIWDLRSPVFDQRDLLSALKWSGERATAGSGVEFVVTGTVPLVRPSPRVEQQLLRIAQEAIANAVRHAGASSIHLHLDHADAAITLRVRDNGRGFDANARVLDANGHCGLASMKERAREVNGRLDIRSAPGRGVEITAVVPATPVHAS
jgi:signal transduction histidine kinase/ligand-binding sensor domain-containing protein